MAHHRVTHYGPGEMERETMLSQIEGLDRHDAKAKTPRERERFITHLKAVARTLAEMVRADHPKPEGEQVLDAEEKQAVEEWLHSDKEDRAMWMKGHLDFEGGP